jgi:hypothetical protein
MKDSEFLSEIVSRIKSNGYSRPFVMDNQYIICGNKRTFGKQNMDALLESFECFGLKDCASESSRFKEIGVYAIFIDFDAVQKKEQTK